VRNVVRFVEESCPIVWSGCMPAEEPASNWSFVIDTPALATGDKQVMTGYTRATVRDRIEEQQQRLSLYW